MNLHGPTHGHNVVAGVHTSGGTTNFYFADSRATTTSTLPTEHTATHYLPFSRNRRFIGRGDELHELQQKLLIKQECQKIAVVGLGGIGKTQIVLEFAQWVKRERPEYSVFWVSAVSLESFEQACTEIARILRIPRAADDKTDVKELVRWHLSDPVAGKWLLVVDNVDDMQLLYKDGSSNGVVDFLPESDDGLTVFTSRRQEVGQSLVGSDVIVVGKMSEDEAVKFLSASLRKTSLDHSATKQLVAELEHLPLAIAHAAAYINTNNITISNYLDLIRSTDADLITVMSREFHDSTRRKQAPSAVATTWVVSFKQILSEDTDAADLLAFMSCIEWKGIPLSILPSVQPRARMVAAIGMICSYSFLSKREDGEVYDMHRLVHLAMRIWLEHSDRENHVQMKAVEHITDVFPSNDYENRTLWREFLPHALRVSAGAQADSAEEVSKLDLKVGRCLQVDGRVQEAVTWLEKSFQWRERHRKETHRSRLAAQHALASAYEANGQIKEAVELLKQVVQIQGTTLAETHPHRLASQHALASAYEANGQIKEAIELLEQVVQIEETTLEETHPDRLASQHTLAIAYQANGQVKEAVELLKQVVQIRETTLEETHPDRLASQHTLAIAYQANGQMKEAIELLEQVVQIEETTLEETHPDRLASQHELARAYQANGQVKEAVELLKQVVQIAGTTLAETHPDRLASQHELARAYQANGQVKEAVELLKQVVQIRETTLAETHPSRLASQYTIASAYKANGQIKEAVELLKQVVQIEGTTLAKTHPDRLASQHALASAYKANGQIKEAIELLEQVVQIKETTLAETHPSRLASQYALAIAYQANGQVKKAVELLEQVVQIAGTTLAETHPDRLASQHELARAYQANGQVKEAVELLEQVVQIEETTLAETHPDRLASQYALASAYEANGQVEKAVELSSRWSRSKG